MLYLNKGRTSARSVTEMPSGKTMEIRNTVMLKSSNSKRLQLPWWRLGKGHRRPSSRNHIFLDTITALESFCSNVADYLKSNQQNIVISFPRTGMGVRGENCLCSCSFCGSFQDIQVCNREFVFFNKFCSHDKICFVWYFFLSKATHMWTNNDKNHCCSLIRKSKQ